MSKNTKNVLTIILILVILASILFGIGFGITKENQRTKDFKTAEGVVESL